MKPTTDHSHLADAISRGLHADATGKEKLLADQAKAELMESYMPLAVSMANKFAGKLGRQEAISAAYLGMAMAMRSYKPDSGAFSSWARLYIKRELLREVDRQHLIRLPLEVAEKRAMIDYLKGNNVAQDVIADKLNITAAKLISISKTPRADTTIDTGLCDAMSNNLDAVSDAVLEVQGLLAMLPSFERYVLEARFGIGYDGLVHSYEEIADILVADEVSIRQAELRGIISLRQMKDQEHLMLE